MLTISEIAELAGVSKSTVSRVMNNGYVSAQSRKKVEAVIAEYNWRPSQAAVSLSKKEAPLIGVVIPEIDNTFFAEIMKGVTEVANTTNYSLMYFDTQNSAEKELKALSVLSQQYVSGIIIAPANGYSRPEDMDALRTALSNVGVPTVILDREFDLCTWDGVYYQNYESGLLATQSLIKAGNKSVGIIQGDMDLKIARERYRGYEEALRLNGMELDSRYIYEGDFSVDTAYSLTLEMLDSGNVPEGIVTSNNRTTIGLLRAFKERGVKIGHDIALVAIDDVPLITLLLDNFSYVGRDNIEMGRASMQLLLERIANPKAPKTIRVMDCIVQLRGAEMRK